MNSRWTRRLIAGLGLIALNAVGCAQEREPINQVQADALSKEFFVGKISDPSDDPIFYWRNFVVDGSEAQSMVGIGSWGGVDRIKWEITENMLIARRAYNIAGDNKGDPGKTNGSIVAAYPITKHFDIKRAYNPQTGEDLNVVTENTTDRVWYQRDHMRVDWSLNLVDTPLWFDMFAGKVFGDIKVTPLAYYVNDRSNPDAPHFEPEQGYFDVTSKFWVEPESTHMWGMDIPSCVIQGLYTGSAVDSCDPQEAVVRSSYWKMDKVPSAADFEPLENTHAALDIVGNPGGLGDSFQVGIVTPPRVEWDPQYGYTDAGMESHMHVHNIWKQSHIMRGSCTTDAECGGGSCVLTPDGNGAKACTVPCSYDKRGDADNNGTDDQCENANTGYSGNQGSQCSSRNWCTLPIRDRRIKPVTYWVNQDIPAELLDHWDPNSGQRLDVGSSEDLIESWNQLMRFSVAKAREVECRRTNTGDRGTCHGYYFYPNQTEMVSFGAWDIEKPRLNDGSQENAAGLEDQVLTMCHNPVRPYDNAACGPRGTTARVGDIRRNFMYYWPYASRAPWGGIANWEADPVTGMIIGAAATTMGRSATYAAAMVRDIIMVANGELSFEDITNGTPAALYEKRLRDGRTPEVMSNDEIQRRVSMIDAEHASLSIGSPLKKAAPSTARQSLMQIAETQKNSVAWPGPQSTSYLEYDAIAKKVRGQPIETQMVDPNWALDVAGMNPSDVTADNIMDMVSPLRGMDVAQTDKLNQLVDLRMQARGICFGDIYAGNVGNLDVQGVAKWFANKYNDDSIKQNFPEYAEADAAALSKKRADLIYDHLWKETYKGIALHEVGHSLGMLHQFASSFDSANYNPQYWQLRTHDGDATASQSCNGAARCNPGDTACIENDTCMGPRYLDPETADEMGQGSESRPGINYFANTSTMEYQNERFFENVGLGQYDLHTMNVLYGRVLQTFDPDIMSTDEQQVFAPRLLSQLVDFNLVNSGVGVVHYTEQARLMKVFDPARCRDATEDDYARGEWRIVHGKVCSAAPKDYAFWQDFDSTTVSGWEGWGTAPRVHVKADIPNAGSVRWPYRWGVSSNAYLHTNPSDAGADMYEATVQTINKFQDRYPWTYFRRQNRDWNYRNLPSRVSREFYERLRAYHWNTAINNARLQENGSFAQAAGSDDWWRPYIMAETKTFDAISEAFMAPQIGEYQSCIKPAGTTATLWDSDCGLNIASSFSIDAATGRYVDPDFDSTAGGGGSWDYQNYVNHAGFTFEKSDASRTLTDGRAVLFTISRENYLDGRNVNINFRSDMPEAIDRLLGGVLSGDFETVAPYVLAADGPNPPVHSFQLGGAAEPTRPAGSYLLFPNVGYKQQVGTLVFAHIFARLNGDLTLANKMRIWIDGGVDQINIPDAQKALFTDPESGYTYVARRYGNWQIDGKTVDKGIASRMLHMANLLAALAYEVQGTATNPTLDAYGRVQYVLDADGFPKKRADAGSAATDFRNYVGLLDASVQLGHMVGYGPFNGWGSIDLN
ncbi:MAG: hypothetical protein H6717_38335 [Polyangiaceae bacterium]|nr:hypothetical protein [Polyangiaceae bacterium]